MDEDTQTDILEIKSSPDRDRYVCRRRLHLLKTVSTFDPKNEFEDATPTLNRRTFNGDENYTSASVSNETPSEESAEIVWKNSSDTENFRISLDGQMKAPPEYQTPLEDSPKAEVEFIVNERVNESAEVNSNAQLRSGTYELENFQKHALLIFNQENIEGFSKRFGTDKDVEKLTETFSELGFEVDVKHDLEKREILEALNEFCNKDFSGYGCVAVAVLTHGTSNGLLRAMDQQYSEQKIINYFKNTRTPTLAGKPKMIIIQACRGSEDMRGVPVLEPHREESEKDREEAVEPYTVSVESDMLLMHSSYIGKPSHRDAHHGTWFIQTLCRNIKEHYATTDMHSILTEVKREVAINYSNREYNRKTHMFEMNKQMPVTTSTLTRKLFLRKFGEPVTSPPVDALPQTSGDSRSEMDSAIRRSPKIDRCLCYLNYFEYVKNCLKIYIDDHPNDLPAANFYKIACTIEDNGPPATATSEAWYRVKMETAEAIALHLRNYAGNLVCPTLKYLHIYRNKR